MATPIVLQLQQDALDKDVATSDLLLKAKIVATKLDLKDALRWIELELSGYDGGVEIPGYRWVHGEPRGYDPWQGRWLPVMFTGDGEVQGMISKKSLGQSVSELEHWLTRPEHGELMIPFHPHQIAILCKALETEPTQMSLFIGLDRLKGIISAIRNKVLDWALSLEKAGILGEGISFTQKEKAVAKEVGATYLIGSIGNFAGNIGHVSDRSTVNANQTVVYGIADLRKIVEQIKAHADALGLPPEQRRALDVEVVAVEEELSKPKPDKGLLRRSFDAIKRLGGAVTGNLIAEGIVASIDKIPWDSLNLPF